MGLTASHGNAIAQPNSSGTAMNSLSTSSVSVNPNLVCDPGVTCGSPQAMELLTSRTYHGETFAVWQMDEPGYSGWIAVGCGVGLLVGGVVVIAQMATNVEVDIDEYQVAVSCSKGALGAEITSIIHSIFVTPPLDARPSPLGTIKWVFVFCD